MKTSTTERVSIASYNVEKPGRYEISVSGEFEPRVFSTGRNIVPALLVAVFVSVALLVGGYGAAAGIAVWAYFKRNIGASSAPPDRPPR